MTETRKATEILLDLENKLGRIEAEYKLINVSQKLILQKLNELVKPSEIIDRSNEIITPNQSNLEVESNFYGTRISSRPEMNKATNADITFQDYVAKRAAEKSQTIKTEPQLPKTLDNQKKIPVVQKVEDTQKKTVFMAEVNISDEKGNHLLKTKTNAMGKWQAQLSPGNYVVKVSKIDMATSKKVEVEQKIIIPKNTNNTVSLNTFVFERQ